MKVTYSVGEEVMNFEVKDQNKIQSIISIITGVIPTHSPVKPKKEKPKSSRKPEYASKQWLDDDDKKLTQLFNDGASIKAMGRELKRTPAACNTRLYTLKLKIANQSMAEMTDEVGTTPMTFYGDDRPIL